MDMKTMPPSVMRVIIALVRTRAVSIQDRRCHGAWRCASAEEQLPGPKQLLPLCELI